MQKGKKGALLTVGWIWEMGMTKLGAANLMDTSALPPAALEDEFWTFGRITLSRFKICC